MFNIANLTYPLGLIKIEEYPELIKQIQDDWERQTSAFRYGFHLIDIIRNQTLIEHMSPKTLNNIKEKVEKNNIHLNNVLSSSGNDIQRQLIKDILSGLLDDNGICSFLRLSNSGNKMPEIINKIFNSDYLIDNILDNNIFSFNDNVDFTISQVNLTIMYILEMIVFENVKFVSDYDLKYFKAIALIHYFIKNILTSKSNDTFLENMIAEYNQKYIKDSAKFSAKTAYTMIINGINSKDKIDEFAINLLLNTDYFNIEFLLEIRKVLRNDLPPHLAKKYLPSESPHKDCVSLMKSDYRFPTLFFRSILNLLNIRLNKDFKLFNIPRISDIIEDHFIIICALEYTKFITNMYMLIFMFHKPKLPDSVRAEKIIGGWNQACTLLLYMLIENKLNINEKFCLIFSFFLENLCLAMQPNFDSDRFEKLQSLIGKISRIKKRDDFDNILDEIGEIAKNLWQNEDSQLDHINMAISFKNDKKYAKYFAEKNFESRLKRKMKEVCIKNEIPKILGVNVFRKNFKRTSKK